MSQIEQTEVEQSHTEDAGVDADERRVVALVEELLAQHPPAATDERAFLEAQYDLGLAWVHFPEGRGGLGVSPKLQKHGHPAVAAAGGPIGGVMNPIGYGMCAPAVLEHGDRRAEGPAATAVHQRAHLVPAVLRARCRARTWPRWPAGRTRRRRVDRQRPEGLDDPGAHLHMGPDHRPHRPRRAQAPWHHRLHRRHGGRRGRGAPAAPDDRRGGVQRGLLHRRRGFPTRCASTTSGAAGACRSRPS